MSPRMPPRFSFNIDLTSSVNVIIEHFDLWWHKFSLIPWMRPQNEKSHCFFLRIYSFFQALLKYGNGGCIRGIKWMWENKKPSNISCFFSLFVHCFLCVWMSKGIHDVFVQWLSIFSSIIGSQNTSLLGYLKLIIQVVLSYMWS